MLLQLPHWLLLSWNEFHSAKSRRVNRVTTVAAFDMGSENDYFYSTVLVAGCLTPSSCLPWYSLGEIPASTHFYVVVLSSSYTVSILCLKFLNATNLIV